MARIQSPKLVTAERLLTLLDEAITHMKHQAASLVAVLSRDYMVRTCWLGLTTATLLAGRRPSNAHYHCSMGRKERRLEQNHLRPSPHLSRPGANS